MAKAPHHSGSYHRRAMALRAAANADPGTRCWRCGRTLAEHPPTKTGRAPRWTAGHVEDRNGNLTGELAPEPDVCNFTEGARKLQRRQGRLQTNSEPL